MEKKQKIGSIICIIMSIISLVWIIYSLFTNMGTITRLTSQLDGLGYTYSDLGLIDPMSSVLLNGTLSIIFAVIVLLCALLAIKDIGKSIPKIILIIVTLVWMIGRFIPILQTQQIQSRIFVLCPDRGVLKNR